MEGDGRFADNILVERPWRRVKYEEVYVKDYETVGNARSGLDAYLSFYNNERLRQGLDYRTLESVYRDREVAQ
jgi:putative transposase